VVSVRNAAVGAQIVVTDLTDAVLTSHTLIAVHQPVALIAASAIGAVECFHLNGALDAEAAADVAKLPAVLTSHAVPAPLQAKGLGAAAAIGAEPLVALTAIHAVVAAVDAQLRDLAALAALGTVGFHDLDAVRTQTAILADIHTLLAGTAILAEGSAVILALAAEGAGGIRIVRTQVIFLMAIHALLVAPLAQLHAVSAAVAEHTVTVGTVHAGAAVGTVFLVRVFRRALPAFGTGGAVVKMAIQTHMIGAGGAFAAALVALAAFLAQLYFVIQSAGTAAVAHAHAFVFVALGAHMVGALGAFSAAVIALAAALAESARIYAADAAVGAVAEVRLGAAGAHMAILAPICSAVLAFAAVQTVVFSVAVPSAVLAAVVAAAADVVVTAACAAVFALHIVVPAVDGDGQHSNHQQQTQHQAQSLSQSVVLHVFSSFLFHMTSIQLVADLDGGLISASMNQLISMGSGILADECLPIKTDPISTTCCRWLVSE
jgi:hypothetical protein